jgi:hypothetical protein
MSPDDEKLRVLVCSADTPPTRVLFDLLKPRAEISRLTLAGTLEAAQGWLANGVTTIFIDPLDLGLSEATDFVLSTRKTHPGTAFVLFVDAARAESHLLYRGDRAVFHEFPRLDKSADPGDIAAALDHILRTLRNQQREAKADEVITIVRELASNSPGERADALVEAVEKAVATPPAENNTVFLSSAAAGTGYVAGLRELLQDHGFRIVPDGPALDGIRAADFVLCLLTKERQLSDGEWTPDAGVIEEKAAALALDKYLVLLVEDGVTGFGTLQGDRRQHRFTPTEFTSAALKAVRELRIAAGRGPE